MAHRVSALALLLVLLGVPQPALAGKPEIVRVAADTYLIFKEDHKGIFGSLAKMKVRIIKQANDFATSQGKVLIPVSCKEKPLGQGPAQWASFEYQFKLLPKEDPAAKNANLGSCPELVVQTNQVVKAEVTTKHEVQDPEDKVEPASGPEKDLYTELLKLDDLRKRGILTEEEFQSEKRKLLEDVSPPKKDPEKKEHED